MTLEGDANDYVGKVGDKWSHIVLEINNSFIAFIVKTFFTFEAIRPFYERLISCFANIYFYGCYGLYVNCLKFHNLSHDLG